MTFLKPRTNNRIVMLCASLNDKTSWPFWKFLQMKKIRGVTDLVMLAFTTESGTFEARIDGTEYTLKNLEHIKEFRPEVLDRFLEKWHVPGSTYFVYGGHGMGDYLELEQGVTSLQCHELASIMGKKQYQGILFDACFMANLDCAYYLRNNTRYIGACEGYMWEHDYSLDAHIFNTYTASAMSRFKDPLSTFQLIQRDYTSKSLRGDFAVLDTTYAEPLYKYCQKNVIPRIYDRVSFFTAEQQSELELLAEDAMRTEEDEIFEHNKSHEVEVKMTQPTPRQQREERLRSAIQYEHSLYPSEVEDKQITDLFQYLVDIAREGTLDGVGHHIATHENTPIVSELADSCSATGLTLPNGDGIAPRTLSAEAQGRFPDSQAPSHDAILTTVPRSEGLELFRKVVVSHQVPKDEKVYATKLGGLSIVAPELSRHSQPMVKSVYHRAAFKRKANEFLQLQAAKKEKNNEKGSVTMSHEKTTPAEDKKHETKDDKDDAHIPNVEDSTKDTKNIGEEGVGSDSADSDVEGHKRRRGRKTKESSTDDDEEKSHLPAAVEEATDEEGGSEVAARRHQKTSPDDGKGGDTDGGMTSGTGTGSGNSTTDSQPTVAVTEVEAAASPAVQEETEKEEYSTPTDTYISLNLCSVFHATPSAFASAYRCADKKLLGLDDNEESENVTISSTERSPPALCVAPVSARAQRDVDLLRELEQRLARTTTTTTETASNNTASSGSDNAYRAVEDGMDFMLSAGHDRRHLSCTAQGRRSPQRLSYNSRSRHTSSNSSSRALRSGTAEEATMEYK